PLIALYTLSLHDALPISMRLGGGVRAREQEAPVRVVGPARPGLLAAERPFAVTSFGPGTQAREVAARVRLAEALAEDQLAAEDRSEEHTSELQSRGHLVC